MPAEKQPVPPDCGFGPYVLETANRRLVRDGVPVAITARVFDILVALVRHSGEPVDKDTLIAEVWGDAVVEEGNLARQVSTLRKVLGDSSDDRYIVTLPERGYQFVAPVRAMHDSVETSPRLRSGQAPPPPAVPIPVPADAAHGAWRRPTALVAGVAAVLAVATYMLTWARAPISSSPPRIVVLPFKNLGPVPDEYVAAGITEEITNRLSGVQSSSRLRSSATSSWPTSGRPGTVFCQRGTSPRRERCSTACRRPTTGATWSSVSCKRSTTGVSMKRSRRQHPGPTAGCAHRCSGGRPSCSKHQAWRLLGDTGRAARAFDAARALLEAEVSQVPGDGRLRSSLGIAYAGLGRHAEALREARHALELMPYPRGFDTTVVREDVALVATMAGQPDLALEEIAALLASPAHFSVQLLRLDPRWDPLRAHPRYAQLLESWRIQS